MYACLFGEYPVSATKDHVTMATKVLNHTFHLPSIGLENKFQVKELLFFLLEKDPNQRLCTLEEFRQTSFMMKVDFNRVYAKIYSPLDILKSMKHDWKHEISLHYKPKDQCRSKQTTNGIKDKKHFYENIDDNQFFQAFSE